MTRDLIIVVAIAASNLSQPAFALAPSGKARRAPIPYLPLYQPSTFLDGYSLRVFRSGELRWNGSPVSEAVLENYVRQFAALPHGAGKLFVAFEPDLAPKRSVWVRRMVVESGLCEQKRCAEIGWNVRRPVVN